MRCVYDLLCTTMHFGSVLDEAHAPLSGLEAGNMTGTYIPCWHKSCPWYMSMEQSHAAIAYAFLLHAQLRRLHQSRGQHQHLCVMVHVVANLAGAGEHPLPRCDNSELTFAASHLVLSIVDCRFQT